jgi:RimJ/RimL family protein N-acetyltransferase
MRDLYRGKLDRLAMESSEDWAKAMTRWQRDTEYHRLADSDPARPWSEKKHKEWIEKRMDRDSGDFFPFSIRTLAEDRLIGEITLSVNWVESNAWVGIIIGERDCWGKGYGTDAMRLVLAYAFMELNLSRVTLGVHAYNPRAIRSYEKAGFKIEGAMRGETLREGRRTDGLYMGILRDEWLAQQGVAA